MIQRKTKSVRSRPCLFNIAHVYNILVQCTCISLSVVIMLAIQAADILQKKKALCFRKFTCHNEWCFTLSSLVRPRLDDVDDGLRRSKRTRVLPLQTHLSERIRYERRKSGLVIVGIDPPIIPDDRIRRKNSGKQHDRKSGCRSRLL